MIKNSPAPVDIAGTKTILNQVMYCICKIKINATNGTGFFCKIPYKNRSIKVLMTNYHVLDNIYFKQNKEITLFLNDNKEVKIINLQIERKTYFNEDYDIAMIELKENDNINNYLELDDNLFKDETKAYYKDISIYILQYPLGEKASVSYGLSTGIDNYEIKHICSTEHGSSGSPILNLSTNKVIGIHKQGSKKFNFNLGTCLKFPLNDFYNNNSMVNSIMKPNSVMLDLFNDMKKSFKPGPKMNVTFETIQGHKNNLIVRYGTTIDELLKYYLSSMNRTEFIGSDNKIVFLYNASKLKFGDQTTVETYFKLNTHDNIVVNYDIFGNWYNWKKEEEEQIKKEREKIYLENQALEHNNYPIFPWNHQHEKEITKHQEKEITVKFNKKGSIFKIKLSDEYMVAELIDEYFKKSNTSEGKFTFNGQILTPMDTSCLFEVGLDDNSEIIVSSIK